MKRLRPLLAATMFLTRVPVPAWVGHDDELLARSTAWFPVVGVVVGAWGALAYAGAALLWPATVAAALAVTATVWFTGAFHEDALADACDGFGGGWERSQVLAIMKDSRVGSYGAVSVTLSLIARVLLIAVIGQTGGPGAVVRALIAAHVLARWSSLPLINRYAYVRDENSRSRPFASAVTTARLAGGTTFAVCILIAVAGAASLPLLAIAAVVTMAGGRYFFRRIGGITGDCLGAANQLVELACYLTLAAHGGALLRPDAYHAMLGALPRVARRLGCSSCVMERQRERLGAPLVTLTSRCPQLGWRRCNGSRGAGPASLPRRS